MLARETQFLSELRVEFWEESTLESTIGFEACCQSVERGESVAVSMGQSVDLDDYGQNGRFFPAVVIGFKYRLSHLTSHYCTT